MLSSEVWVRRCRDVWRPTIFFGNCTNTQPSIVWAPRRLSGTSAGTARRYSTWLLELQALEEAKAEPAAEAAAAEPRAAGLAVSWRRPRRRPARGPRRPPPMTRMAISYAPAPGAPRRRRPEMRLRAPARSIYAALVRCRSWLNPLFRIQISTPAVPHPIITALGQ